MGAERLLGEGRATAVTHAKEPRPRTLVVLPEGGPYAGKGVVDRMAEIGVTVTHSPPLSARSSTRCRSVRGRVVPLEVRERS